MNTDSNKVLLLGIGETGREVVRIIVEKDPKEITVLAIRNEAELNALAGNVIEEAELCQGSVPESIICFLEGNDFEDVVRLAVSLGGDADTMSCIAGSIAACIYPIPEWIAKECEKRLKPDLLKIMKDFEKYIR